MIPKRDPQRPEPEWAGDAARSFAREWLAYARVAVAMTIRPRAFVRAWLAAPGDALNPIAASLQGIAILAAWAAACVQIFRPEINVPWWAEALFPVAQLLSAVLVGIALHLPLKLLGAERQLPTTVAVLLYLTAGPMLLMRLVSTPIALATSRHSLMYGSVASSILTIIYYVVCMAAAHRMSWWRVLLAILLGIVGAVILILIVASIFAHYFHFKQHGLHL
jgi:hypothetical protein